MFANSVTTMRLGFQSPSSVGTWPPRTRNLPPYFSTVPGTCFRYSSNPAGSVTSFVADEIRRHVRTSSSRRRELSHSSDVPHRRLAEVPLVLAVEVRGIVVTDSVAGFRRVEIFAKHQAPGLLKPQLLLELQRTHRRHGPEVRMEPGHAHAQLSRDLVDPQRLVEVHAQFLDRANHAVRMTAERREVAQAAGLSTREQAIHDFTDHERHQHAVLNGHVHEPHEPQRRVEQVCVERADIDRLQAAAVAALHGAGLHHSRRDDGWVQHQPEAEVWPLRRRLDDLTNHRELDGADHVVRGVVPEVMVADHQLLAALRDHAERGFGEAVEAFGRPRTATKVQTRLHFDRPLMWRCPGNPLGEFLVIGPHPTRLSFARGVLHVPHRKTPFPSRAAFGGLYKHLRGLSYRRYRVGG